MKYLILFFIFFLSVKPLTLASEYMFQANKGAHIIDLGYSYKAAGVDFKNLNSQYEWNWNYQTLSFNYEWGMTDYLSLGLGLDYVHGNLEFNQIADWHISGIEDINLFLKSSFELGSLLFNSGVHIDLSLEKQEYTEDKVRYNGSLLNGRDNSTRGRHEITPFIAISHNNYGLIYGFKLAYRVTTDQEQEKTDATGVKEKFKYEGEEGFLGSAYLEHQLSDQSTLGYAATYMTFEDLISKNENASKGLNVEKNYEYAMDGWKFDIYGKVKLQNGLDFLPRFSYYLLKDKNHKDTAFYSDGQLESSGASYKVEFKLRKTL